MDGPEFDAWTRRRFGLAAGGALAALVGLATTDAKKKRCKKLGARCRRNGKRKCCGQLKCDATGFAGQRPTVCCRKDGSRDDTGPVAPESPPSFSSMRFVMS